MENIKTKFGREIKRILHILNPLAGHGMAKKIKKHIKETDETYMSESPAATSRFIKESCQVEPDTCFTVYGGDGTVHRAVNAVMSSECNKEAMLKIVPIGSGNDFVRSFDDMPDEFCADVMKFNDRYAANIINMGFDCNVVKRADKVKKLPLINGPFAYILGVVGELFTKKPLKAKVVLTYEDGTTEKIDEDLLLIAIGNGRWYGGGFKAAALAQLNDGYMDLCLVDRVSRADFIRIIPKYKSGQHVDENGNSKYPFVRYQKCKKVVIESEGTIGVCGDGEVSPANKVVVEVIPKAIAFLK